MALPAPPAPAQWRREVVSRISLRESAFPDGAEILFKLPYSKEKGDAAVDKTYTNLGAKNREIL